MAFKAYRPAVHGGQAPRIRLVENRGTSSRELLLEYILRDNPPPTGMYGFTLVELLIAMTLTAVIGMVLFSTYSMVMDNGKPCATASERESERVFWGILTNDIAGLCLIDDKRSTLPALARADRLVRRVLPPHRDGQAAAALRRRSAAVFRHQFTSGGHARHPLPGPVCVEYVLRNGNRSAAFIRRERAYCGVKATSVVRAGACPQCEVVEVALFGQDAIRRGLAFPAAS